MASTTNKRSFRGRLINDLSFLHVLFECLEASEPNEQQLLADWDHVISILSRALKRRVVSVGISVSNGASEASFERFRLSFPSVEEKYRDEAVDRVSDDPCITVPIPAKNTQYFAAGLAEHLSLACCAKAGCPCRQLRNQVVGKRGVTTRNVATKGQPSRYKEKWFRRIPIVVEFENDGLALMGYVDEFLLECSCNWGNIQFGGHTEMYQIDEHQVQRGLDAFVARAKILDYENLGLIPSAENVLDDLDEEQEIKWYQRSQKQLAKMEADEAALDAEDEFRLQQWFQYKAKVDKDKAAEKCSAP